MKATLLIVTLVLSGMTRLFAQTYPFWDAANPGMFYTTYGPTVATTNAVFAVGDLGDGNVEIIRWTQCGGWEALPGLTIDAWESGSVHAPGMMTVHDHYLYAVGLFRLDGYTDERNNSDLADIQSEYLPTNEVQIARFDFNTGLWSPVGQNFTATNVALPSTIAVDSSNRIYVGFEISKYGRYIEDGDYFELVQLGGATLDMLDVSTNDGASWQVVGGGLTVPDTYLPGGVMMGAIISALCADGTNLYIGGNFVQTATAVVSTNVIMWTGDNWRALAGISQDAVNNVGGDSAWDVNIIDSIASIGTNIYVAGAFYSPQDGLARFSNVTGESLPVADPATYLGWDEVYKGSWGLSLAVNDGHLYLAGWGYGVENLPTNVACLMNPQDPYPTDWRNLSGGTISVGDLAFLAAAPNGNAVFVNGGVGGHDDFGNYSDGFSRWLVGPDDSSSAVTITNVDWETTYASLSITGTPGSHWQVMASTDLSSWIDVGSVTLWGGTNTFVDNRTFETQPYYYLTNNCGQSAIAPCSDEYTLCVTNDLEDELHVIVWDDYYDTFVDDYIPAYSSNCYTFSPGHIQLRCYCYDYTVMDDESCWFTPSRQSGGVTISGFSSATEFNTPIYSESGGPLCQ
ncbi:MAG TPA: hypothetical protein VK815_15935 [Candidatus Acidoferrales bacterium]|jgi:hypothetical protein|nr:hypothetical protein [Candidatus Acidoferrales bacterium]